MGDDTGFELRDNRAANRYEAWLDGALAGVAAYEPKDGWLVFTHTEIDPAFSGRGVGSRLAREALDDVRTRGLRLTPQCPFIAGWIRAHPEYRDLVVGIRGTSLPRRDPGAPVPGRAPRA